MDSNTFLVQFIGDNWMAMIIIYAIFRAMFPNSRILTAVGETFSGLFPVFKQKQTEEPKKG